ncbi:putative porin [Gynurincola endophyticus]|uniref:putative porin n=1 Tax=Gynurincola endophyticus TaxID=2479004 RepID=UPI000F8CF033|nr:putative porin [Gynurincola endophyticus]
MTLKFSYIIAILSCILLISTADVFAQGGITGRMNNMGRGGMGAQTGQKQDSLKHRTGLEDSITIRFRYLDSTRMRGFDSSVYDFTKLYPVKWHDNTLGNIGNATQSFLFNPNMKAGWDHGFHAYDRYNFRIEDTRFYNTTRPYTELGYVIGTGTEQIIDIVHTQNIRPNWNAAFNYRLINSKGIMQNQNSNHNSYKFTSWYQSKNKRYQNFLLIIGNKLGSSENGGIQTDQDYLNDKTGSFYDRSNIPTQLGNNNAGVSSLYGTTINTGTLYTNSSYVFRQQYDIGQKDSIVNDSVTIPLFYPRLRLEHTANYSTYKYRFKDFGADSTYYFDHYGVLFDSPTDSLFRQDLWRVLTNDFSFYSFPDKKNTQQYIKLGAAYQHITGNFSRDSSTTNLSNIYVHGEYRNRTRNQKWDMALNGAFWVGGHNAADYWAYASLKRYISRKIGYLQVGAQNTNRTPSYIFETNSSFFLDTVPFSYNKENITAIFGAIDNPAAKFKLTGTYYLINNLTYFENYYQPKQATSLFNVLKIDGEKHISVTKTLVWKLWGTFQQRIGNGPVNLPLFSARTQFGYEGSVGFRNLLMSLGVEARYFTPYYANAYSPLLGQFYFQENQKVQLQRPDIAAYMHFRIRSFSAYVRAENLNAFDFGAQDFIKNNVPILNYPANGLVFRIGIYWSFVN